MSGEPFVINNTVFYQQKSNITFEWFGKEIGLKTVFIHRPEE